VIEGSGKIPYPRTLVEPENFALRKGHEALQTYYMNNNGRNSNGRVVDNYDGSNDVAAHTFCGSCGVHLLYAPSSKSNLLYLNVDCLQRGSFARHRGGRSMDVVAEDEEAVVPVDGRGIHRKVGENRDSANARKRTLRGATREEKPARERSDFSNSHGSPLLSSPLLMAEALETACTRQAYGLRQLTPKSGNRNTTPNSKAPRPGLPPRIESSSSRAKLFKIIGTPSSSSLGAGGGTTVAAHDDDISEPTIPADLMSYDPDAVDDDDEEEEDDDVTSRSLLSEETAKSLRRYMSKHVGNNHHNPSSAITEATAASSVSSHENASARHDVV